MQEKPPERVQPQEPLQPQVPKNGNGNGHPKPSLCDQLQLDSLTADPSTVPLCGTQSSTISWSVTEFNVENVSYQLVVGGLSFNVSRSGSRVVQVTPSTIIQLLATSGTAHCRVGSLSFNVVANPACFTLPVGDDAFEGKDVEDAVNEALKKFSGDRGDLTFLAKLRQPPPAPILAHITAGGIVGKVAAVLTVTYHPLFDVHIDINVDVDATVILTPLNCGAHLDYSSFGVNAHLPIELNFIFPPPIVQIIDAVISNELTGALRGGFLQALQNAVDKKVRDTGKCLCAAQSQEGALLLTLCPP